VPIQSGGATRVAVADKKRKAPPSWTSRVGDTARVRIQATCGDCESAMKPGIALRDLRQVPSSGDQCPTCAQGPVGGDEGHRIGGQADSFKSGWR